MALAQQRMNLADYLAWENQQPEKNEFYRGEIFAMVGARRAHGRVVLNLAHRLMQQLEGSPCQVFSEGMKLQIEDDAVFYPDLMVTCDKADLATEMIFRAPTLVVEVLSPSTQAFDRGLKFAAYRRLPSLREYILVDPDARSVEGFRRNDENLWVLHDMSDAPELELASLGCSVPLAQVFDGVDPPAG
ncbi:MAG: Uma2 family endonuclease [Burkholderiales bacterium]|nr:Uma2 family endonuclease [Burkholderiales bacterium]